MNNTDSWHRVVADIPVKEELLGFTHEFDTVAVFKDVDKAVSWAIANYGEKWAVSPVQALSYDPIFNLQVAPE